MSGKYPVGGWTGWQGSMIGEMMAGTLQPEFLPIFLVGGLMSASVGYSSKVVGSGV